MARRAVLVVLLFAAVATPASAGAGTLSATKHGVLDLGDVVVYRIDGPGETLFAHKLA